MANSNLTYLGPAGSLVVGGKAYMIGDSVSLSEDAVLSLEASGHRFSERMPKAGEPLRPQAAMAIVPPPARPYGDDGGYMDLKSDVKPSPAMKEAMAAQQTAPASGSGG